VTQTPLQPVDYALLFVAGAVASGINSIAGGGTLVTFPFLTFGLQMPVNTANATNSVALWPGSLGGVLGLRNLFPVARDHLARLALPTVIGSALGAWMFIAAGATAFKKIVPYLILFAAILLLFQPKIKKWLLGGHPHVPIWIGILLQFCVAVYGGYFGAGMGIMMMAAFALFIEANTHEINLIKNSLGVLINLSASVLFFMSGLVDIMVLIPLVLGSLVGGYIVARWSQTVPPDKLRMGVAIYGVVMAIVYFVRSL
jgi:uncharacterized membrane protein YfcA